MKSQGIVAVLTLLTLGTCAYVAINLDNRASVVTSEPAATSDETLAAINDLRTEIQDLRARMDQRLDAIEERSGAPSAALDHAVAYDPDMTPEEAAAQQDELSTAFAAKVAESVQTQLDEKLDRMESRQRDRNMGGESKAPIDDLAAELSLTTEQQKKATEVFDGARDVVFDLLKAEREGGGNLLDDLVDGLKTDGPKAFEGFVGRIFTDKVPGSDKTYLAEMITLTEQVRTDLTPHLSDDQMDRLEILNVALLEVETGYDPVEEYVLQAIPEAADW